MTKPSKNEHLTRLLVSQGGISNILEELVVQPLLVSISALTFATETVRSILKIDDLVSDLLWLMSIWVFKGP